MLRILHANHGDRACASWTLILVTTRTREGSSLDASTGMQKNTHDSHTGTGTDADQPSGSHLAPIEVFMVISRTRSSRTPCLVGQARTDGIDSAEDRRTSGRGSQQIRPRISAHANDGLVGFGGWGVAPTCSPSSAVPQGKRIYARQTQNVDHERVPSAGSTLPRRLWLTQARW